VSLTLQEVAAILVSFDQHAAWESHDVIIRYTHTHTHTHRQTDRQ